MFFILGLLSSWMAGHYFGKVLAKTINKQEPDSGEATKAALFAGLAGLALLLFLI